MPMAKSEGPKSPPLVGTKDNPARDPSETAKGATGKGSVGDKALMDSVVLVAAAWVALFLLWYSVRNHNI